MSGLGISPHLGGMMLKCIHSYTICADHKSRPELLTIFEDLFNSKQNPRARFPLMIFLHHLGI